MPKPVLVVEDDPDVAGVIRLSFDPAAYSFTTAETLLDARAALAGTEAFAVAIVDLLLPDGSGVDLVREMKARRPTMPVVVLTAGVIESVRSAALDAGADLLLMKPFDPDHLAGVVADLLRRR